MTDLPDYDIAAACDVAADRVNRYADVVRQQIAQWEPRPCPPREMDAINGRRVF